MRPPLHCYFEPCSLPSLHVDASSDSIFSSFLRLHALLFARWLEVPDASRPIRRIQRSQRCPSAQPQPHDDRMHRSPHHLCSLLTRTERGDSGPRTGNSGTAQRAEWSPSTDGDEPLSEGCRQRRRWPHQHNRAQREQRRDVVDDDARDGKSEGGVCGGSITRGRTGGSRIRRRSASFASRSPPPTVMLWHRISSQHSDSVARRCTEAWLLNCCML